MPAMEITTRIGCSNMCSYCPQDKLINAYKRVSDIFEMDLDTFKKCIDKIPLDVNIHFSGLCEPWLNPHCTEMLVHSHNKGHRIQVFTSLVGMTLKDIEILKTIPFELFIVHLPDSDGRTHIDVNDRYMEILAASTACIPNAMYIYYDNINTELVPILKNARKAKWTLTSRARNIEINEPQPDRIPGRIRCSRTLRQNILLPNGDVAICCNDYGLKHILGNLKITDYDSLFSGQTYQEISGGLMDDSKDILCRYCEMFVQQIPVQAKANCDYIFNKARQQLVNADSTSNPLISVLMAVRNTEQFLPQAIESVLAETYTNFEFLIYDDMSTDDCPQIIDRYARQDNRIRKYSGQQKAPSFAHICTFLISESKGRYFTIADSDDICMPDRLQTLVSKAAENPLASIVFGRHQMFDEKSNEILTVFGEPVWPFKYFVGGFVHLGASLVSRKHYELTDGYEVAQMWSADRDVCFKMLEHAPFAFIDKILYLYRRHTAAWTFEKPKTYDAIGIIAERTLKRNIPVVRRYLEQGVKKTTYRDYVALSYVTAHLLMRILGPARKDANLVISLADKLGFSYESFQELKHDIDLRKTKDIDQLRNFILEMTKMQSQGAPAAPKTFISKARKVWSILKPEKPRIYILCPDSDVPFGGIKQLYRHADILNDNGFDASILHSENNFRCTWFENSTKISYLSDIKMNKSDYLVLPEVYGRLFCNAKKNDTSDKKLKDFINSAQNRVIFNQNCYKTFEDFSILNNEVNPFWKSDSVLAAIVVSEDSRLYMNHVFPNLKVFRIHNSVKLDLFSYQHKKKKQICFMPRKLKEDIRQVVNILRLRNALKDFKLVTIENKTEFEVAQIMKDSLIFLSFSHQEGNGLPPIEALICGCLVIGYDGRGASEYFGKFCWRIDADDIVGFAKTVEDVITSCTENFNAFDAKRWQASSFVRKMFSQKKEIKNVVGSWKQIISESDLLRGRNTAVCELGKITSIGQNTARKKYAILNTPIAKIIRKTGKAFYFACTDFSEFRRRLAVFFNT